MRGIRKGTQREGTRLPIALAMASTVMRAGAENDPKDRWWRRAASEPNLC